MLGNLLKLDFLSGKKTYLVGVLMLLHAVTKPVIELINGQPLSWSDNETQEVLLALGLVGLRKAM